MTSFLEIVSARRSVRSYTSQEIESDKLEYVLNAARLAPSACNIQPWSFIVVKDSETQKKLQDCYSREWFNSAPVYIIACADHSQSWKRKSDGKDHADIDLAIATEHLCLAATELGLGTCWVCNFDVDLCSRLFDLPKHIEPVAIIPIGYPESTELQGNPSRKELPEIIRK